MKRYIILIIFGLLSGCAYLNNAEGISTLQALGRSQDVMNRYVDAQNEGFSRLKQDIALGKLREGISKQRIIAEYGDPVYCQQTDFKEECLYRKPLKYFGVTKAYLYFDENKRLESWRLDPEA